MVVFKAKLQQMALGDEVTVEGDEYEQDAKEVEAAAIAKGLKATPIKWESHPKPKIVMLLERADPPPAPAGDPRTMFRRELADLLSKYTVLGAEAAIEELEGHAEAMREILSEREASESQDPAAPAA